MSTDFRIVPKIGTSKRSDLVAEPRAHYVEPSRLNQSGKPINLISRQKSPDQTRSYTSVSLTLRQPSSEPQPPIDIRSQGSSLTYSTSSLDPRGFQSRLRISIGPGSVGSVASARIRPPMGLPRPNSLIPHHQASQQRPPGSSSIIANIQNHNFLLFHYFLIFLFFFLLSISYNFFVFHYSRTSCRPTEPITSAYDNYECSNDPFSTHNKPRTTH